MMIFADLLISLIFVFNFSVAPDSRTISIKYASNSNLMVKYSVEYPLTLAKYLPLDWNSTSVEDKNKSSFHCLAKTLSKIFLLLKVISPPHNFSRGNEFLSIKQVLRLLLASVYAAALPAGPPPI